MDIAYDYKGKEINIGDKVRVWSLLKDKRHLEEMNRVVGEGIVYSLSGIPSHPEPLIWVRGITSCHHPLACEKI